MSGTLVGEMRGCTSHFTYVRPVPLLHFSLCLMHIQMPGVLIAISNLHTIDVDEYDIKGRLTCLVNRWGVTCSSLGYSQHQGQVALVRIHSRMRHDNVVEVIFTGRVLFLRNPESSHEQAPDHHDASLPSSSRLRCIAGIINFLVVASRFSQANSCYPIRTSLCTPFLILYVVPTRITSL